MTYVITLVAAVAIGSWMIYKGSHWWDDRHEIYDEAHVNK